MFETTIRAGVLQVSSENCRWFSTTWNGGYSTGNVAYAITVPEGWNETDLNEYQKIRRERAEFVGTGPTLFTGVSLDHVRGARADSIEVYATVGLSNPATLPMETTDSEAEPYVGDDEYFAGTVNLIVGTTRALTDGALGNLLATVIEAKTATLMAETGFTGTTSDAVVVASDPAGERARFVGSATRIGNATRACVRDAVRASLASRYPASEYPNTIDEAEYGVITSQRTEVFQIR